MFGFFGADKKQDSPAPQPQNTPQQPQRIIEKGNYVSVHGDCESTRGHAILDSFGTTDLDLVLERYAPEHSDILKEIPETQQTIRNNQKVIHEDLGFVVDKIKEQDKKLQEQSEALTAMQEKLDAILEILKKEK